MPRLTWTGMFARCGRRLWTRICRDDIQVFVLIEQHTSHSHGEWEHYRGDGRLKVWLVFYQVALVFWEEVALVDFDS